MFSGKTRIVGLPANDRGLAYGDGLFETMRVHRGGVPWFDRHWTRLAEGAARLRMGLPERALVETSARGLLAGCDDGVLKLLVTRGAGGRGYGLPVGAEPTWILSRHPLPPKARAEGQRLRWCDTRLAAQPLLAGIKHCNRLEQVLARGEWTGDAWDEGLVRDTADNVVSATSANLLALRDGRWRTPRVDRCGVAGICRGWLLQEGLAEEAALSVDDIEGADAVVLCNAVRGILPVAWLGDRAWPAHPAVHELRRRLAAVHPAFNEDLA
jgi:4-amino-4-deoxychorismate lyase